MNLSKKKNLAARTLGVGKDRIIFVKSRLDEIKEAITKQDILELHREKEIIIKEIGGRKKIEKKKRKRKTGNIRKKLYQRKENYILLTKKLRMLISDMKRQEKLSPEEVKDIRRKIKNKVFRSREGLKEYLRSLKK